MIIMKFTSVLAAQILDSVIGVVYWFRIKIEFTHCDTHSNAAHKIIVSIIIIIHDENT